MIDIPALAKRIVDELPDYLITTRDADEARATIIRILTEVLALGGE